jgi:4-oxalocrotonate tautomerase
VEGFTRVASEALGMPASAFYVLIQENEPENWGIGGKTLPKFMAEKK